MTRMDLQSAVDAYDKAAAACAAVSSQPARCVHEIQVRDAAARELADAISLYLDEHPEAP